MNRSRLSHFVVFVALSAFTPTAQAASKADEEAGAKLFHEKGCGYCHGANLQGTHKGPALTDVRKKRKATQITEQIQNGGQKMPAFRDSLDDSQITQLVAFLRAKHKPTPASPPDAPAANPPAPQPEP